jgi:hypothetical protein
MADSQARSFHCNTNIQESQTQKQRERNKPTKSETEQVLGKNHKN